MSDHDTRQPVVLGRIAGAWGVKGWIRIHPYGDDPAAWKAMPGLWLGQEDFPAAWQFFRLQQLRVHGDGVVAQLDGVADRDRAESLSGTLVGALREDLPSVGADEYYWGDLVGLEVVNREGQSIGRVKALIETGANDVLVVADAEGSERLLPFVNEVVLNVDVPAGRIDVAWGADW